ncbi:MAG: hypothetical protein COW24_01875 [Candidatus Kerfeldbacteria bacterium CG15_BIG_FIL_POST_REV_8_21_14_020_45_12]|uniref:General secretion pathway GspH domain-containing protein n=1 Tax=Candidatus Kerfeldbacteria bacterium CG15_BIG_FIL_POST_REV_8_21_14_020_45_12 TaxID=2014247 RepID=A0A2M7H4E8_9BACT|nr:MAG: hypothetical protein COW24_01875 [Candidatus Kerfeldbacteria bacterium CG15_BIG_FIL_POST_REV_8_21_14_020_45_12]PJA94066.1 MAG: hypothetical protein CO132_00010 [Candidatus Kerfeldbacteria bacterium CG_4_9_14_3_um_filter_45_8]
MRQDGFTLLEILLSVVLIGVMAMFSVPVYQRYQVRNDLHVAADTWVQTSRRAETLARSGSNDTTWGIEVHQGSITLFQGADYASRDSDMDEVFSIPSSMTFSGDTEILFEKFTGAPSAATSTTLTSTTGQTKTITINSKGMVDY